MKTLKLKQAFAAAFGTESMDYTLYGLDEEGSLWVYDRVETKWSQFPMGYES